MTAPRPIFVHGALAGSVLWDSLSDRFDGAAVLGLPGHPQGAAISDATELAGWIALAITQLDGPRVLIGHGFGALLALETAYRHPETLDGVVMLGAAAQLRVPDVRDAAASVVVERLLAASLREPDSDVADALAQAMQAIGPATLTSDLAMAAHADVGPIAGGVRCPVLIIAGEHDRWAPPREAAELAATLPNSHMVVVEGAAHLVHVDAPATAALLIAAFLARVELTLADQ